LKFKHNISEAAARELDKDKNFYKIFITDEIQFTKP